MHLSLPRRRAGRSIFGLKKINKKSRQEAVLSASGSQEGMESHGWTNTGPHSSPSLASRQQWAVRERHQRPYSLVSRHAVVYTDASTTGWGATFNGLAVLGVWTGPPTALAHKLPRVAGSTPGPEPSQEALTGQARTGLYGHTVTVAYINRQGFRRMSQLARHLLLWSQKHLRSLRAIHIPGLLNRAANELSRAALPREWRLHPQTAQLIERLLIASCLLPDRGNTRHGMHWHSAGRGAPASMCSPQ